MILVRQFTRRGSVPALHAPCSTLYDQPAAAGIYDGQKKTAIKQP